MSDTREPLDITGADTPPPDPTPTPPPDPTRDGIGGGIDGGIDGGPAPDPITEDAIGGLLDVLAMTMNQAAAPEDDPTRWLLDQTDMALMVGPLTRIVNRYPRAASAMTSGAADWTMLLAGAARYVVVNTTGPDPDADPAPTTPPPGRRTDVAGRVIPLV